MVIFIGNNISFDFCNGVVSCYNDKISRCFHFYKVLVENNTVFKNFFDFHRYKRIWQKFIFIIFKISVNSQLVGSLIDFIVSVFKFSGIGKNFAVCRLQPDNAVIEQVFFTLCHIKVFCVSQGKNNPYRICLNDV